jgi:hypothetical protein
MTATISDVASPVYAASTGMSSFGLTAANAGDIWLGYVEIDPGPATVTTMTSTNASWTRVNQAIGGDGKDYEIWIGRINAIGSDTVNMTFNGSVSSSNVETGFQEFTSSRGRIWCVDTEGFIAYPNGLVIDYPTLYARNAGSLYWGYGKTTSVGSAGSTSGYGYDVNPTSFNVVCWNANAASGAQSPTAVTTTGQGQSIGVVLTDYALGANAFLVVF